MTTQRTFTAPILLPGNPALPLQAVPKQYSDAGDAATLAASQPLDPDLTAIGGLTPSNDDIIQRKSGLWVNRSIAQLKSDLGVVEVPTNVYPLSGYGLIASTAHPDLCGTSTTAAAGAFIVSRIYVPANTTITGGSVVVLVAGTTPGSTNASGFVLFSDAGTQLAITANTYTLFTSTGWQFKAFTTPYTTGSVGEFLRLGMVSSCSGTLPQFATSGAQQTLLTGGSRTSTTTRRVVAQASVTAFPASITPSTYGTVLTTYYFYGAY